MSRRLGQSRLSLFFASCTIMGLLAGCAEIDHYERYDHAKYTARTGSAQPAVNPPPELQAENEALRRRTSELETLLAAQTTTATSAPKVGVVDAGPRYALVIGNSNYPEDPLKNPANDAADLAVTLSQLGFETEILIDADYPKMGKALNRFGDRLSQGGVGLFYFAGHGVQVEGDNFLLPIDQLPSSEDDVRYTALAANQVLAKMESAGNDLNIVILDACRDNPFAGKGRSSTRGLSVSQGLNRVDAPTGSVVIYATAPGQVAFDGDGRNGVFTKHLLQAIRQPETPLLSAIRQARLGVMSDTDNKQVPWVSEATTTEFYFLPGSVD